MEMAAITADIIRQEIRRGESDRLIEYICELEETLNRRTQAIYKRNNGMIADTRAVEQEMEEIKDRLRLIESAVNDLLVWLRKKGGERTVKEIRSRKKTTEEQSDDVSDND